LFLARCAVQFNEEKPNLEELLWKGHRGYISYNEKDLVKLFEKQFSKVEKAHATYAKEVDKKRSEVWGFFRGNPTLIELHKQGKTIMDDLVDEIILI